MDPHVVALRGLERCPAEFRRHFEIHIDQPEVGGDEVEPGGLRDVRRNMLRSERKRRQRDGCRGIQRVEPLLDGPRVLDLLPFFRRDERKCQACLRVHVDEQDFLPARSQGRSEVRGGRRLSDAPFVVDYGYCQHGFKMAGRLF